MLVKGAKCVLACNVGDTHTHHTDYELLIVLFVIVQCVLNLHNEYLYGINYLNVGKAFVFSFQVTAQLLIFMLWMNKTLKIAS